MSNFYSMFGCREEEMSRSVLFPVDSTKLSSVGGKVSLFLS